MKAERECKFIPIYITLETEEEAEFLYRLLECHRVDLQKALDERTGITVWEIPYGLDTQMYNALLDCYEPNSKDC